jgi:hypothetical protein
MKQKIKVAMVIAAALVVLALMVSLFAPLIELHERNCIYCGDGSKTIRLLGVTIWQAERKSTVHDGLTLPDHTHRMIDICGSRIWVFRSDEHWDTFGWAARGFREAFVAGIAAQPERKAEILKEYLEIDPSDKNSQNRFIKAYRIKDTEQIMDANLPFATQPPSNATH